MTDIKDRLIDILSRAAERVPIAELEEKLLEICDGLESGRVFVGEWRSDLGTGRSCV